MTDSSSNGDAPHLTAFLKERLVELGLDYDTYGPYVLGIEVGNDDDDEAKEEISQVCQLLQASSESETHADDDEVWVELGRQILEKIKMDNQDKLALEQARIQLEKQNLQDQLAQAKQEKKLDKPEASAAASDSNSNSGSRSSMDDAAKKAMLQRFAYEQDEDQQQQQQKGEEDGGVVTNKQVAQQANLAKSQELKSRKVTTKKEEQAKTKEAKLKKVEAKEDRKKRATKGERKA
jgi:hypothetical protein